VDECKPLINDLAFIPAMRGGAMGFNMLVGGGLHSSTSQLNLSRV